MPCSCPPVPISRMASPCLGSSCVAQPIKPMAKRPAIHKRPGPALRRRFMGSFRWNYQHLLLIEWNVGKHQLGIIHVIKPIAAGQLFANLDQQDILPPGKINQQLPGRISHLTYITKGQRRRRGRRWLYRGHGDCGWWWNPGPRCKKVGHRISQRNPFEGSRCRVGCIGGNGSACRRQSSDTVIHFGIAGDPLKQQGHTRQRQRGNSEKNGTLQPHGRTGKKRVKRNSASTTGSAIRLRLSWTWSRDSTGTRCKTSAINVRMPG